MVIIFGWNLSAYVINAAYKGCIIIYVCSVVIRIEPCALLVQVLWLLVNFWYTFCDLFYVYFWYKLCGFLCTAGTHYTVFLCTFGTRSMGFFFLGLLCTSGPNSVFFYELLIPGSVGFFMVVFSTSFLIFCVLLVQIM